MLARHTMNAPTMWSELSRLSREMDRFFGGEQAFSRTGVYPSLNLYDDGESIVVRTELPGVDPKDIDIHATANVLTIKGERKRANIEGKVSFHRQERGHGSFSRSITLPQEIDANKVQASYKLGVLELVLPKAEAAKPRKIAVQS